MNQKLPLKGEMMRKSHTTYVISNKNIVIIIRSANKERYAKKPTGFIYTLSILGAFKGSYLKTPEGFSVRLHSFAEYLSSRNCYRELKRIPWLSCYRRTENPKWNFFLPEKRCSFPKNNVTKVRSDFIEENSRFHYSEN